MAYDPSIRYLLSLVPLSVVDEVCQARRGLDYASATFFSATRKHQQEVFDQLVALGEELDESSEFRERGRSPHFERVFSHSIGVRIELTEVQSSAGRNRGMTLFTLPGAVFHLQATDRQMLMLWKVVSCDGFKHFTRLDFQNTELEPAWDADRVHRAVEAGELWVKGYGTWRPYGELDAAGECPGGRTLYWGSPRAERQGRTYDKGRQLDWEQPAIRDEVQFRGAWAQSYGRELVKALRGHLASDAMATAVDQLTVSALNQHLQYWTLNGADPKGDKNWQRKAEPADWFQERIGRHCEPIKKDRREVLDLDSSVSWGIRQYGRLFALWAGRAIDRYGFTREFIAEALLERFESRLLPEDLQGYYGLETAEEVEAAKQALTELQNDLANAAEAGGWDGE